MVEEFISSETKKLDDLKSLYESLHSFRKNNDFAMVSFVLIDIENILDSLMNKAEDARKLNNYMRKNLRV